MRDFFWWWGGGLGGSDYLVINYYEMLISDSYMGYIGLISGLCGLGE